MARRRSAILPKRPQPCLPNSRLCRSDRKTAEFSRFLRRQLDAGAWLAEQPKLTWRHHWTHRRCRPSSRPSRSARKTSPAVLRRLRAWVIAHVMVRDVSGLASLTEVTETMTALADFTVATACDYLHAALAQRHGQPLDASGGAQQLIVIGMGKARRARTQRLLGCGLHLRLSGRRHQRSEIHQQFRVLRLSWAKEAHPGPQRDHRGGQVFRVDMRLRPNGDSGPLVCSFEMLETISSPRGASGSATHGSRHG